MRVVFSTPSGDETLRLMLDILREKMNERLEIRFGSGTQNSTAQKTGSFARSCRKKRPALLESFP